MDVRDLQRGLITLGYDLGTAGADGVFGRLTQAAVRKFQADFSVQVQYPGTVGPKTESALLTALAIRTGRRTPPVPTTPFRPWLDEARRLQGTKEIVGKGSNPAILKWAAALGSWVKSYYSDDDIPWCGLFIAHVIGVTLPNEPLPSNPLGALNWSSFGIACQPTTGAILTFKRTGGGHVGLYVGEDATAFHVLGGNQSNQVNVTRIARSRHVATRWPATAPPPTTGAIPVSSAGALSTNEA